MKLEPWKKLSASRVLAAAPWLEVFCEKVELPDGRVLDDFYRVVFPDFVVVVPFTAAGELVMVRSYKHGVGRIILSAPAGYISAQESPIAAAQRELLEETGYRAPEWHSLQSFTVDGNRQCGKAHFFLARRAAPVAPPNQGDPNEVVEVELMSPQRFFEAVRQGRVALLTTIGAVSLAMLVQNGFDGTPLQAAEPASVLNSEGE